MANKPNSHSEDKAASLTQGSEGAAPTRAMREFSALCRITIPVTIKYIEALAVRGLHLQGVSLQLINEKQTKKLLGTAHVGGLAFEAMFFIYMFAVFDAFVSDIAKFLFFTRIDKLPNDISVPINELGDPVAASAALGKRVQQKIRNLGARNIVERIKYLEQQFDLDLKITDEQSRKLSSLSEKRNLITHNQDIVELGLDSDFIVKVGQKTKVPVLEADNKDAIAFLGQIIARLFECVVERYRSDIPESELHNALIPVRTMVRVHLKPDPDVGPSKEATNSAS